jgi:glycosyltransferase involved in cell wall biosynthesis
MNTSLRILVLNLRDRTNPRAGGAERHLHELFSRLAARGHRVTLHCGSYPGARRDETVDGMRIVRRGGRLTTAISSIGFYLGHRGDFDVIVDYTCQLHFLTPLYVRLPRVAMAMHLVGDVYRHDLPLGVGRLFAWWEAFSLRRLYRDERFVAISASTAAELRRHGIERSQIRVIHCGRYEPAPPADITKTAYPSLVYHGRLKRYKRVNWLIESLPEIQKAIPGVRLHIVGEGDQLSALQRSARRLDLDGWVVFHGWLPDVKRWQIVGASWLNVQPSLKEGWGLTVVEAGQCGVPSVASAAGGLMDAVIPGETGELFDVGDRADMVRRIIRLLTDPHIRERMGKRAADWANSFAWDKASLELEETLQTAVAEPLPAESVLAN